LDILVVGLGVMAIGCCYYVRRFKWSYYLNWRFDRMLSKSSRDKKLFTEKQEKFCSTMDDLRFIIGGELLDPDTPAESDLELVGSCFNIFKSCGLGMTVVKQISTGKLFITGRLSIIGESFIEVDCANNNAERNPCIFPVSEKYFYGAEVLYFSEEVIRLSGQTIETLITKHGNLGWQEFEVDNSTSGAEPQKYWVCFVLHSVGEVILECIAQLLLAKCREHACDQGSNEANIQVKTIAFEAIQAATKQETKKQALLCFGHSLVLLNYLNNQFMRIMIKDMVRKSFPEWKFHDYLNECKSFKL